MVTATDKRDPADPPTHLKDIWKMKSLILLVLPLIAGAQTYTVRRFQGGWLEFTIDYPDRNQKYDMIEVDEVNGAFRSINIWENISNLLLYHDTERKTVTVGIKKQLPDLLEYEITFHQEKKLKKKHDKDDDKKEREVEVKLVTERSQRKTVKMAAGATVTCDHPQRQTGTELFFCKENSVTCEEILPTRPSEKINGPFRLRETDGSFSIVISHASSRDSGVYWCAEKTQLYRAGFQEISIEVEEEMSSTAPSTRPTSASPLSGGVSQLTVVVVVVVVVVVCGAALVLTVVLIYKSRSGLKKKQNKKENNQEEAAYDEIQERPHTTESSTAMRSIYVTADFPSTAPPTEGPVGGAC